MTPNLPGDDGQSIADAIENLFTQRDWFQGVISSKILFQVYSIVAAPFPAMSSYFRETGLVLNSKHPVKLTFAGVKDVPFPSSNCVVLGHEKLPFEYFFQRNEVVYPASSYVFLTSPLFVNGIEIEEKDIRDAMDSAVCLLRAQAGYNFIRDKVVDCFYDLNSRESHFLSRSYHVPQPEEGPFLGLENDEQVLEIYSALGNTSQENRSRIELAIRTLGQSFGADTSFLLKWLSIEILCAKANRIRSLLEEIYGARNGLYIRRFLGWDIVSQIRHNYVHHGTKVPENYGLYRYLDLVFIDLVRHKLKLKDRRNVEKYLVGNSSLMSIGISPLINVGIHKDELIRYHNPDFFTLSAEEYLSHWRDLSIDWETRR